MFEGSLPELGRRFGAEARDPSLAVLGKMRYSGRSHRQDGPEYDQG
jgi:hypothetical protein